MRQTLAILLVLIPGIAFAAERPPNIIFILADDLGYGDVGCYGQKQIHTPNIDRMAKEGLRFTQAYAGSTVCAPSRCCLMTGLHTGHARVRGNALVPLLPEDRTVAELLKAAGYVTGLCGKWGLGEPETTGVPNKKGFDYFFGYLNQHHAHNYYPDYLWKNQEKITLPNEVKNNVSSNKKVYSPDLITKEALGFIESNKDKPFFLYFTPTLPHANNEAKQEGMEMPSDAPYSKESWPQPQKNHAAMITRLDADVGTLLDKLKELKLDDNTIVFFTATMARTRRAAAIRRSSIAPARCAASSGDDRWRHPRADDRALAGQGEAGRERFRLGVLGFPADGGRVGGREAASGGSMACRSCPYCLVLGS